MIKFGISLGLWSFVAIVHMLAGYLDALKYKQILSLDIVEFVYYLFVYSGWACFTFILLLILENLARNSSRWVLFVMFICGMCLWLPTYFMFDFAVSTYIQSGGIAQWQNKMSNISNALIFFYAMMYTLTFIGCTSVIFYQDSKRATLHALSFETKQAKAQLLLASQQLQLLQSQLSPHFMFNCLGAVSALARTGEKKDLVTAIAKVGNLLRYCVEASQQKQISLQDELAFIQDYLSLQKLRFAQRFEYKELIETLPGNLLCPPFLIQPLIENAFTHGVAHSNDTVLINLTIKAQNNLQITVSNTCVHDNQTQSGMGSAMINLKQRLKMMYADNFDIIKRHDETGYTVTITVPFEHKQAND